jgi:hypothetical protein
VSHLIDLVATLLAAAPSEQTARLLRKDGRGPVTTTA